MRLFPIIGVTITGTIVTGVTVPIGVVIAGCAHSAGLLNVTELGDGRGGDLLDTTNGYYLTGSHCTGISANGNNTTGTCSPSATANGNNTTGTCSPSATTNGHNTASSSVTANSSGTVSVANDLIGVVIASGVAIAVQVTDRLVIEVIDRTIGSNVSRGLSIAVDIVTSVAVGTANGTGISVSEHLVSVIETSGVAVGVDITDRLVTEIIDTSVASYVTHGLSASVVDIVTGIGAGDTCATGSGSVASGVTADDVVVTVENVDPIGRQMSDHFAVSVVYGATVAANIAHSVAGAVVDAIAVIIGRSEGTDRLTGAVGQHCLTIGCQIADIHTVVPHVTALVHNADLIAVPVVRDLVVIIAQVADHLGRVVRVQDLARVVRVDASDNYSVTADSRAVGVQRSDHIVSGPVGSRPVDYGGMDSSQTNQ